MIQRWSTVVKDIICKKWSL